MKKSTETIVYSIEPDLTSDEFVDVLRRSGLAERRPVAEKERIEGMLRNADLIVGARVNSLLVGISRAITDYHFCTYLPDLAVDVAFQKRGIGKRLIEETHILAGKKTRLILLSAPAARDYYPHIGMIAHDSCWQIPPED
jgi:ribosomal protein S18 acetylase RimI-like enzyme